MAVQDIMDIHKLNVGDIFPETPSSSIAALA